MTFTPVQEAAEEVAPDVTELLIKEARREAQRRRLRSVVAVLIVLSATIVIWRVSGGGPHAAPPTRVNTSNPAPGTPTGSANGAVAAVLEGQSVMGITPFGSSTLWVVTQNAVALSGGGQGIELTTNAGRSWTNVTPPGLGVDGGSHFMGGFFALSSSRAWVAYGGIAKGVTTLETTADAGRTWKSVGVLPSTGCTYQFVTVEDGTCSALEGAGGSMVVIISRTDDGGASWHKVFDNSASAMNPMTTAKGSIPFGCDKSVDFTSVTKGFALFLCNGGSGAIIYETLDGGTTWVDRNVIPPSSVPEGGGGFWGAPVFNGVNAAVSYEVGHDALVYVTHDGGRSFLPVYPPGTARPWKVDIVSPSMWRLTLGKEILGTDNAGRSWFSATSDLVLVNNDYLKGEPPGGNVEFTTKSAGWFLEEPWGSNPPILRTVDGGRHWVKVAVPGTGTLSQHA